MRAARPMKRAAAIARRMFREVWRLVKRVMRRGFELVGGLRVEMVSGWFQDTGFRILEGVGVGWVEQCGHIASTNHAHIALAVNSLGNSSSKATGLSALNLSGLYNRIGLYRPP